MIARMNSSLKLARLVFVLYVLVLAVGGARSVSAQSLSPEDIEKVKQLFGAANTLLNNGDAQQAVQKYNEAISIAPSIPGLYINRGLAYISLSKYPEAITDADKALELSETDLSLRSQLAIAYQIKALAIQSQGDNKTAVELYSKAIAIDPYNPKFRNGRGNSYRLLEQYQEALADYTEAIKLDATIPHPLINRAAVYRKLNNPDAALKDLDDAVRLDKANAALFLNRGNIYFDKGRYDEALQDYSQAISIKPKPEYFYSRSLVYFKQGKYELAVKEATESIALDPSNAEAFRARSIAYSKLGQNSLALADIRKAVALKEASVTMRYNLAFLLFRTGQLQPAIDEAAKTIAMDPNWRAPYILRAAAYAKLGNAPKAKIDQDAAAKLSAKYLPKGEDIFSLDLDIVGFDDKKQ